MTNRALGPATLVALLVSAASATTCSFPDITLAPTDTTGSGATTGIGGDGASLTTSSGTGGSGAGSGATAGGGTGGVETTGGAGGTTTSNPTTSSTCPLDVDEDGAISWVCAGGTDCADDDANTNPDITAFSSVPIQKEAAPGTKPYDKNCNGQEEAETPVLACVLGDCPQNTLGYKSPVACGADGPLGHCVAGIGCTWKAENPAVSMTQKCK